MVEADLYCSQLDVLSKEIQRKHPSFANRKGVILHHDNSKPHVEAKELKKFQSWIGKFYLNQQIPLKLHHLIIICSSRCENLLREMNIKSVFFQFGLAIHQNDHQARRRFVEWAQNEMAVVPDFHTRILFSDEAHFWLNGYVNKQNCRIWSEANPQVYVETPLHPEKLTVWCTLWAAGILLQKR
ncbi:DUF4817 domain-containing protein [Trichonephila clavipes]|nr:DUF4817 domain-containing protein [Trichonephila clavipes]